MILSRSRRQKISTSSRHLHAWLKNKDSMRQTRKMALTAKYWMEYKKWAHFLIVKMLKAVHSRISLISPVPPNKWPTLSTVKWVISVIEEGSRQTNLLTWVPRSKSAQLRTSDRIFTRWETAHHSVEHQELVRSDRARQTMTSKLIHLLLKVIVTKMDHLVNKWSSTGSRQRTNSSRRAIWIKDRSRSKQAECNKEETVAQTQTNTSCQRSVSTTTQTYLKRKLRNTKEATITWTRLQWIIREPKAVVECYHWTYSTPWRPFISTYMIKNLKMPMKSNS